jgi:pimeloyl-ACP methyl ester carboxylesterase
MAPIPLNTVEQGREDGPLLVVMHGLFGSAQNWATIARRLADRYRVVAVDMRNHGASPWDDAMTYDAMAGDVIALLRARAPAGGGSAALLGHSMGGKAAMLAALREPGLVDRLIVADVAPAAYPPVLGAYVQAMRGVDLSGISRRAEADEHLKPRIPEPGIRAFLLLNLVQGPDGFRWRLNLPVLGRDMTLISGFPEVPAGTSYDGPTLFLRGERSDYVAAAHEPEIRRLFPRAEIATIDGAGHWVHAEKPDAFLDAVTRFLGASGRFS